MVNKVAILSFASATTFLAGCATASNTSVDRSRIVEISGTELPAPAGVDLREDIRPYFLGPGDRISVQVFGEDSLNAPSLLIGGDGMIALPAIGEIKAQGFTTGELAKAIGERLRPILQRPDVSINVVEAVSETVLLDGAVAQPGSKPIFGRTTLQKVIANAGGVNDTATKRKILILRSVGGKSFASFYDLSEIRRGAYDDPEVFAGDKIFVGESASRRALKDILSYVPLLYLLTIPARL